MIGLGLIAVVTIYVLSAAILTWMVARALKPGSTRRKVVAVLAAVLILVPSADELVGIVYFRWLCAKEGGVEVVKVVRLGSEYWDQDGSPKFIKKNGDLDTTVLDSSYEIEYDGYKRISGPLRITKASYRLVDASANEVLSTYTRLGFQHGWALGLVPTPKKGFSCPSGSGISRDLILETFKK